MPTREFLFERRCSVIVAPPAADYRTTSVTGVEISDLRVTFKVTKTLEKHPNTAEINIYNLAETTRSQMQAKGSRVILRAGYRDMVRQIFIGDARLIDHTRDQVDWETKIEAGDGERAYLNARVSQSFPPGSSVGDVVFGIAENIGLDTSGVAAKIEALGSREFSRGYAVHGRASAELDRVLRGLVYSWSIQDGRLQILSNGVEAQTERIIVLSEDSGLIGSPEMGTARKKKGKFILKFRSLLSAEIRPGGRVQFASEKHRGVHRVLRVTHSGDTAGGNWYTDGEVEVIG